MDDLQRVLSNIVELLNKNDGRLPSGFGEVMDLLNKQKQDDGRIPNGFGDVVKMQVVGPDGKIKQEINTGV